MASRQSDEPTLADAMDVVIRHALKILGGTRVGKVTAYDPVQRVADVQPVRRKKARGTVYDDALVSQAPVGWWRFGQMVLAGELEQGDEVLLVTCEREIRPWWIGGLDHDPQSPRTHDHTDTVVLPWISALTRPITARQPGSFFMGREDGTAGITIPMAKAPPSPAGPPGHIVIDAIAAGLRLGSASVSPVYLASVLNAIVTPLNATLTAVPPAVDPATVITLANANQVAILGLFAGMLAPSSLSTKVLAE